MISKNLETLLSGTSTKVFHTGEVTSFMVLQELEKLHSLKQLLELLE
jgi:hypothetical protein